MRDLAMRGISRVSAQDRRNPLVAGAHWRATGARLIGLSCLLVAALEVLVEDQLAALVGEGALSRALSQAGIASGRSGVGCLAAQRARGASGDSLMTFKAQLVILVASVEHGSGVGRNSTRKQ